jgi:hypothetical protein
MSFLVSKDGHQLGPWTADQVNAQLAGGMLEPTDLAWAEGFAEWMPLNRIDGLVMPGTQVAPATATVSMAAAPDEVPGLVTAGEATPARRGRGVWVVALVLLAVGGLGAYQFVYGKGDLSSLCSVLVEIIVIEKTAVAPPKVVPPHVQKYQNAAQAAASRVAPIDEVNEQLDLRGDFHFTRNVSGLTIEAGDWMNQFSRDATTTPEAKGMVELARDALQKGGVSGIDALGISSVFVKAGQFRHVAMVHHPSTSTNRLWRVLDNNGTALNGLRLMPTNTVLAVHGRVNVSEMSRWFSDLNKSKPLADAWQSLKKELPMDTLMESWTGEVGLCLTMSADRNVTTANLRAPGLVLVLGVKDDQLKKTMGQQLKEEKWTIGSVPPIPVQLDKRGFENTASQQVYQSLKLPDAVKSLELIPTICQSGNYLVLSLGGTPASEFFKQAAKIPAGNISPPGQWVSLTQQSALNVPTPTANLIFFLAPGFSTELAKWKQLKLWEDVPSGLASALTSLAGSKEDKGLLATVQVRNNGVLFKGYVMGQTSKLTFARVKNATRVFVAELIPQLAKLTHGQWSKLDLPTKSAPAPTPAPETPESSGN